MVKGLNMFLSGNIRCCSIRIAAGIAVLFFLLTGSAGAALGEEWNRTYAGAGNTSATVVWQTTDGGYIFAGATNYNRCNNQWCITWLVRIDAHGNEQWNRTFRDIYGAKSVQQTMDGGYILAGRMLIKTDMNGNEEWNRTFNGLFNSVQQTSDGGYIGAGAIDTGMGDYHPDGWLIKTDENGNEQWNRTFKGYGFGYINSIQHSGDGGFVLAGHRNWATPDSEGGAWLVKVDADGREQWNRTFGEWNTTFGGRGEEAYSVFQTKDGGYILAGFGFLLIKTDANGNMQWGMNRTFKGKDTAVARSVQLADGGGYIIPVMAQLYGGFNKESWLIKVDETGKELLNITLGEEQNSDARSVQRIIDGGYIVAGTTYFAGGSHAWLTKISVESTPASSPTETPIATLTPPEKIAGFEAVLAITILLTLYKTGKRRIK